MELTPRWEIQLDHSALRQLHRGRVMIDTEPAIFRITGPGSVTCLQGLVTVDLVTLGDGSLSYGAFLTQRGMILFDAWILRDEGSIVVITDPSARSTALAVFRKTLPPRLAMAADLTGQWRAIWRLGPLVAEELSTIGETEPIGSGRLRSIGARDEGNLAFAAAPSSRSWFDAVIVGAGAVVTSVGEGLKAVGTVPGGESHRQAARILVGWPWLGAEIDDKTLPQEVRYDQLGAVSYTKGCYIGQETVARVHFRGHPNRTLRGLVWAVDSPLAGVAITANSKNCGQVTSVLKTPEYQVGLGVIRREVATGDEIIAAGQPAQVVELPFQSYSPWSA